MRPHKPWISLSVSALLLTSLPCSAQVHIFDFGLDGDQVVPRASTPATGIGHVELNTDTNQLYYLITYENFLGNETAAHLHAPADFGENGPMAAMLPVGSPMEGTLDISDQLEIEILAGLSYIQVHSDAFPLGEIRGQIVPAPGAAGLLTLAAFGAATRRRRN